MMKNKHPCVLIMCCKENIHSSKLFKKMSERLSASPLDDENDGRCADGRSIGYFIPHLHVCVKCGAEVK